MNGEAEIRLWVKKTFINLQIKHFKQHLIYIGKTVAEVFYLEIFPSFVRITAAIFMKYRESQDSKEAVSINDDVESVSRRQGEIATAGRMPQLQLKQ